MTSKYAQLANLYRVLANPSRLEILQVLSEGEACVRQIEEQTHYRQAYISQQLSILRDEKLVKTRRDGKNVYYSHEKLASNLLIVRNK
jgi:ArsR family transcriptional regulator